MQAISFYLAFAQYFVTLYRGGSRQAVPKINLFASAMLCCYLLWSGDKI